MNKLEEYVLRYQRLHDGKDSYIASETNKTISPAKLEKDRGKVIFDGSQLGKKLPRFIQDVIDNKSRAITLLDYGCGKAIHNYTNLKEHGNKTLIARFNGMIQCYYCYDPAVKIYSVKPPLGMVFDLVCCADVMEHVPEDSVDYVLEELAAYTKEDGTALLTISGNLAGKCFNNGENLHATVKPLEWWVDKLKNAFSNKSFIVIYNDTNNNEDPLKLVYKNSSATSWVYKYAEVKIKDRLCEVQEV